MNGFVELMETHTSEMNAFSIGNYTGNVIFKLFQNVLAVLLTKLFKSAMLSIFEADAMVIGDMRCNNRCPNPTKS